MSLEPRLRAGAARLDARPPLGVDLTGFLRRWRAADGYGQPLETNVLVLDDGERRAAIVALDLGNAPGDYGARMRAAVAQAVGCELEAVLVNCSHTHAAPPVPGLVKTGGTTRELRPEEERYAETLIELTASAATLAVERLAPAVVGYATDSFERGVNRRQRTADGGTVMGWNPDAPCDREVGVLRVDRADDGTAIATGVAYACHPTVVGPDLSLACSDFVGPMRELVRATVGGECLFLQACAANVFPLEAVFPEPGPEVLFGRELAISALRARQRAEAVATTPRETPYASAVSIAVWRREPDPIQPERRIDARDLTVELPLMEPPTSTEIAALARELEQQVETLQAEGAGRERWNPPWLHLGWARQIEQRVAAGTAERSLELRVQLLRIGDLLLVGLPVEPFCEIGLRIKERLGPWTIVLGYSNDMAGYLPVAEEYPFGGYEPTTAQRNFGRPAPFDPSAAQLLVEQVCVAAG